MKNGLEEWRAGPGSGLVSGGARPDLAAVVLAPGEDVPVHSQAQRVMGTTGHRHNLHRLLLSHL